MGGNPETFAHWNFGRCARFCPRRGTDDLPQLRGATDTRCRRPPVLFLDPAPVEISCALLTGIKTGRVL
jgi:hypothetical protein